MYVSVYYICIVYTDIKLNVLFLHETGLYYKISNIFKHISDYDLYLLEYNCITKETKRLITYINNDYFLASVNRSNTNSRNSRSMQ